MLELYMLFNAIGIAGGLIIIFILFFGLPIIGILVRTVYLFILTMREKPQKKRYTGYDTDVAYLVDKERYEWLKKRGY